MVGVRLGSVLVLFEGASQREVTLPIRELTQQLGHSLRLRQNKFDTVSNTGLARCGTVLPVSVVAGAAVPAAVCR